MDANGVLAAIYDSTAGGLRISGIGSPQDVAAKPTVAVRESFPRIGSVSTSAAWLVTQRISVQAVYYQAGDVVTSISFLSGATAASVPTNQWFGLFRLSDRAMLRLTSDDTTTAWAANAFKTLNLSSSYTIPTSGLYYHGCMVKATTVPSITGCANASASVVLQGLPPIISGFDAAAGLTTPASCPANLAALTATNVVPYTYSS